MEIHKYSYSSIFPQLTHALSDNEVSLMEFEDCELMSKVRRLNDNQKF